MKESAFQGLVVAGLRKAGALILNLNPDERMGIYWPDVYVSHRLWRGWIEFKGSKTRLTPGQKQRIEQLRERDDQAIVLRLIEEGRGGGKVVEQAWWDDILGKEVVDYIDVMSMSEVRGPRCGSILLNWLHCFAAGDGTGDSEGADSSGNERF